MKKRGRREVEVIRRFQKAHGREKETWSSEVSAEREEGKEEGEEVEGDEEEEEEEEDNGFSISSSVKKKKQWVSLCEFSAFFTKKEEKEKQQGEAMNGYCSSGKASLHACVAFVEVHVAIDHSSARAFVIFLVQQQEGVGVIHLRGVHTEAVGNHNDDDFVGALGDVNGVQLDGLQQETSQRRLHGPVSGRCAQVDQRPGVLAKPDDVI